MEKDRDRSSRSPTKKCHYCGKEIKKSSYRCPHCGESLAQLDRQNWEKDSKPADVSDLTESSASRYKAPRARIAALIFCILIIVAYVLFFYPSIFNKKPRRGHEAEITSSAKSVAQQASDKAEPDKAEPEKAEKHGSSYDSSSIKPDKPANTSSQEISEDNKQREQKINRIHAEILKDLKKEEIITTDRVYLNDGKIIQCTIIDETDTELKMRHKGLATSIMKERIERVESRTQASVEEELKALALARANEIVEGGLVRYKDEWVTPQERDHLVQMANIRLEKRKIDAARKAEIAKEQARIDERLEREYLENEMRLEREETERQRIEREAELEEERIEAELIWLAGGTKVPLVISPEGGILVPVTLYGPRNSIRTHLKLDTGADMTCITPDIAARLGLTTHRYLDFQVADGRVVKTPVSMLSEIAVEGEAVKRLEVSIGDCGGDGSNGLLGMNFLNSFEFEIDKNKETMVLRSR